MNLIGFMIWAEGMEPLVLCQKCVRPVVFILHGLSMHLIHNNSWNDLCCYSLFCFQLIEKELTDAMNRVPRSQGTLRVAQAIGGVAFQVFLIVGLFLFIFGFLFSPLSIILLLLIVILCWRIWVRFRTTWIMASPHRRNYSSCFM